MYAWKIFEVETENSDDENWSGYFIVYETSKAFMAYANSITNYSNFANLSYSFGFSIPPPLHQTIYWTYALLKSSFLDSDAAINDTRTHPA